MTDLAPLLEDLDLTTEDEHQCTSRHCEELGRTFAHPAQWIVYLHCGCLTYWCNLRRDLYYRTLRECDEDGMRFEIQCRLGHHGGLVRMEPL